MRAVRSVFAVLLTSAALVGCPSSGPDAAQQQTPIDNTMHTPAARSMSGGSRQFVVDANTVVALVSGSDSTAMTATLGKVQGVLNTGDAIVFTDMDERPIASGTVLSVESAGAYVIPVVGHIVVSPGGHFPAVGDAALHHGQ